MKPLRITLAVAALLASLGAQGAEWSIKALEPFVGSDGPAESWATGVNDLGEVVGWAHTLHSTINYHAVLWANGAPQDLGTLGGPNSTAYAINNAGVVVGSAQRGFDGEQRGFRYANGEMTELTVSGGFVTRATAINASGVIAAYGALGNKASALRITPTGWDDLEAQERDHIFAYGINDLGDVVGSWSGPGPQGGGFIALATGQAKSIAVSSPFDINNAQEIVGIGGVQQGTEVRVLGALNGGSSQAFAINDSGDIVGRSSGNAALFHGNSIINLSTLPEVKAAGWDKLEQATGINSSSQIVGEGFLHGVGRRAFILTPIPEPETSVLMAIGLCSVIAMRARKRRVLGFSG